MNETRPLLADKEVYADPFGVIWEYDAETKSYINKGYLRPLLPVTEMEDGLVSPAIFNRITAMSSYKDDLELFKIETPHNPAPYFYLLYSSDHLISARAESATQIRIEIDRGNLYRRFMNVICRGTKGDQGLQGVKGITGRAASKERKIKPDILSDGILIKRTVNIPLDTPISLRFFDKHNQLLSEILIHTSGSMAATWEVVTDLLQINHTATEISIEINDAAIIDAHIVFDKSWPDNAYYKIRQQGPKGSEGPPGHAFLEIKEQTIVDDVLTATKVVQNLRRSKTNDDLFMVYSDISKEVCAHGLTLVMGLPYGVPVTKRISVIEQPTPQEMAEYGDPPARGVRRTGSYISYQEIEDLLWGAVKNTTEDCKDIGFFKFHPATVEPTLNLPHWTPMKQCADRLRYDMTTMDWQKDLADENLPIILLNPRPPEQCCQEDFFWCPNLGDAPCEAEGSISATPRFETESCPCDCEPLTKLLKFTGDSVQQKYSCSLNGHFNQYRQEILIKAEVSEIELSITFGDYCDDYSSFVTECDLSTMAIARCLSGDLIINGPDILNIEGEGNCIFSITGTEGSLLIDVTVNLNKTACCRGYDLTIMARSGGANDS